MPFDGREKDPTTWRGSDIHDSVRTRDDLRTIRQRAHATSLPYQYQDDQFLRGDAVTSEFQSHEYTRVRVHYNCGVERNNRLKLVARGHFWGDDERHQRFQSQYRREPPPTDTVPFDEYEVWVRYQYGTVDKLDDGEVVFRPDDESSSEEVKTLPWGELYSPIQRHLVELEFVRNPPFAAYVLDQRDELVEWLDTFRYTPSAFDVGP